MTRLIGRSEFAAGLALALLAPRIPAATPGLETELAKCSAIAAGEARLACYDALAHRAGAPHPAATPPQGAGTILDGAKPRTGAAPTAPPSASAPAADETDPKNFGLTLAQQHRAYAGVQSIDARIDVLSTDQNSQTHVVLDNGQTWLVMQSDGWINQGDKVTIKRASLGSFLMATPSHHAYRVRRLR